MDMQPWHYFLSLENDLISTTDYVELAPRNARTFSIEFVKLLLLAGSEVDVVAKMICAAEAPEQPAGNINDYRLVLTSKFPGLQTIEVSVPRCGLRLSPWSSWDPKIATKPAWWGAYNNVKHERDKHFHNACQLNVVYCLAGLFALLLYLYRSNQYLQPTPELFWVEGLAHHLTSSQALKLPGT